MFISPLLVFLVPTSDRSQGVKETRSSTTKARRSSSKVQAWEDVSLLFVSSFDNV